MLTFCCMYSIINNHGRNCTHKHSITLAHEWPNYILTPSTSLHVYIIWFATNCDRTYNYTLLSNMEDKRYWVYSRLQSESRILLRNTLSWGVTQIQQWRESCRQITCSCMGVHVKYSAHPVPTIIAIGQTHADSCKQLLIVCMNFLLWPSDFTSVAVEHNTKMNDYLTFASVYVYIMYM